MAGRNPKGAVLDQTYYESKDIISYFENLCDPLLTELRLQKNGNDLQFDARDLSIFIGQLQQFQQEHLGIFNRPTNNPPLRIPSRLFKTNHPATMMNNAANNNKNKRKPSYTSSLSYKQHPLYIILLAAFIFRMKHNWKKWELNNPSKKTKNMELIQYIRTYLIKQKFIIPPKIFLHKSVPINAKKTIQSLVKKINGQLTTQQNNATHVLHGPLHDYNEIDEDWFRTLEKKDEKVLVHWWYYPDSYDSWLVQTDQFEDPEEAPSHRGPWHLNCRWLQDSVKFNELMNEEDYEDIESGDIAEYDQQVEGEEDMAAEDEVDDDDIRNVDEEDEEDEEENGEGNDNDEDDEDDEDEEEDDDAEDEQVEQQLIEEDLNMKNNKNKYKNKSKYNDHEAQQQISMDDEKLIPTTPTTYSSKKSPKRKASEAFIDNSSVMDDDDDDTMQDDDTFSQLTHMNIPLLDPHAQPIVKIREIDIERPALGSRQRKNEFEPYVNGDLSNISQYTIKNIDVPSHPLPNKQMKIKSESNIEDSNNMMVDDKEDNELSILCNTTPLDYNDICWPEWLDLEKVNDMEKLALPEFFNDHQEDYIKYRNYMVEQYYSNPGYYLTISTCKQAFPDADLLSLVRIHSFLEIYDVINSQNDPRRRIFNPIIDSEPEAHMEINPQRSLEKVDSVDLPYLRKLMYDATRLDKIRSAWDIKVEDPMNVDQQLIFKCYHCQQKCNSIRYQNLKRSDFHLCIDCFVNGRFPSVYSSNDFLRISEETNMNNNSSSSGSNFSSSINMNISGINYNEQEVDEEWTDEEILRLLEGVDQYDDDWLMVSEHVGNRTKEQCIMQFLQMPITDEFFNIKLSENELEEVPFANTPNPIMTMVTYLAAHINPGVAGVAAKVAMKELLDTSKNEKLTGKDGDKKKIKSENMEEDVDIKIDDENDGNDNMNTGQNGDENTPAFSKEVTSTATYAALKAAALQARKLSSYEDQEIQHWIRLAVKTMVDKLNLKIQQYEEFDQALENDYQEAEKTNTSLQTSLDSLRQQHFPLPSVSNPQHTMTNVVPTPSTSNNN